MGKVVAIVGVVLFLWVLYPHVRAGEYISPSAIAPASWMAEYASEHGYDYLATPPEGYGWFRFDAWNNPPHNGRQVQKGDFKL